MPDARSPRELDEVVDGLLEITKRTHEVMVVVAARHDLTAQQVGLLRALDEPVSMRAFAEELSCDPSNVTGLVDRVERLGLVDRVPNPDDRRIRMLTLTPKGRRLRDKINAEVGRELAGALGLEPEDHGRVLRLISSLTPTAAARPTRQ
ncbi:MAG TPA: MarR family transcriptional regulator [Acidimicrobiales bacterium]|nr:MarR family transcriptional regulator [Acidimicrobiales bacterium]